MVEERGVYLFEEADDINIPVSIFLVKETDEDGEETGRWELFADNYMPRKGVASSQYDAVADTREELAELLKKHVIPLYQTALRVLGKICEGTEEGLYHWKE